jgi:hypothetical protein
MKGKDSRLKFLSMAFLFLFGLALLFVTCIWALEQEAKQIIIKK